MSVPYYDIGKATLTAGSDIMTGQGTLWLGNARPGDQVVSYSGYTAIVGEVVSNTQIKLTRPYRGTNQSALAYEIMYTPDDPFTQTTARGILHKIAQSALVKLSGVTPAPRQLVRFDQAANAALSPLSDMMLAELKGDGVLEALAQLDSEAHTLAYYGVNKVLSLTALTPYARTLLDDADAAAAQATLGGTATGRSLFTAADAASARETLDTGGLNTANTWRANQHINGRLGINNINPTYTLDFLGAPGVQNISRIGQSGLSNGFVITSDGASMSYVIGLTGPDGRLALAGLKTTAAAANLTVDGSGNVHRSTSSRIYKTDIETLDNWRADEFVRRARPVWYRSLASADPSGWGFYGLIAEEVATIDERLVHWGYQADQYEDVEVPEIVEEMVQENGEDGEIVTRTVERTVMRPDRRLMEGAELRPDGVQYDRITVMLLDVTRRQAEAIAGLQASLASMEGRLAALEAAGA